MKVPQFTLDDYEKDFADRHLLHDVVAKWAKAKPEAAGDCERRGRPHSYVERVRPRNHGDGRGTVAAGLEEGRFPGHHAAAVGGSRFAGVQLLQDRRDCCAARSAFDFGGGDAGAGDSAAAAVCEPGRESALRFQRAVARGAGAVRLDFALHRDGLR